jgi:hypothetical protein
MFRWGIAVSKTGKDVTTSETKDRVVDSETDTLKIFGAYNAFVNSDHFVHNLKYIPIHLYVGVLPIKSLVTTLIGQSSVDVSTNVIVTSTEVSNDSNSGIAADALVYILYNEL